MLKSLLCNTEKETGWNKPVWSSCISKFQRKSWDKHSGMGSTHWISREENTVQADFGGPAWLWVWISALQASQEKPPPEQSEPRNMQEKPKHPPDRRSAALGSTWATGKHLPLSWGIEENPCWVWQNLSFVDFRWNIFLLVSGFIIKRFYFFILFSCL